MTKGLFAGMTEYSHQSLNDIIEDLKSEKIYLQKYITEAETNIELLEKNKYLKKVPSNFINIIYFSIRSFKTAIEEIDSILNDFPDVIQEHHINRLNRIAKNADKIDSKIGTIWHKEYKYKEYGFEDFNIVEELYSTTRDTAVNLLDLYNMANRLEDFKGKNNMKKNNPWTSGIFYLFIVIIIIGLLIAISKFYDKSTILTFSLLGIFIVILIGVFQLKNDDKISEKSFRSLISKFFKLIPFINTSDKNKNI